MAETPTRIDVLARFGHALSDPTRTSLSDHLARLRGCGSVVAVPEGKRMRDELADGGLRKALEDPLGTVLAVDATAWAGAGEGCR